MEIFSAAATNLQRFRRGCTVDFQSTARIADHFVAIRTDLRERLGGREVRVCFGIGRFERLLLGKAVSERYEKFERSVEPNLTSHQRPHDALFVSQEADPCLGVSGNM